MNIFLLISKYVKPLSDVDRVLPAHREFLQRFYDDGTFVVSGPLNPRSGGVIVARAESRERIADILQADPFFIEGVSQYDVLEFSATKHSEAWGRLFS